MKCNRLISLVKSWYLKVQEEAMAPARMVAFMEKHISGCEECLADPDVKQEVEKIREIVLPPSKVPKPKVARTAKDEDIDDDDEYEDDDEGENEGDGDEDDEEYDDDDEDEDDEDEEDEDFDPDLMDDDDEI